MRPTMRSVLVGDLGIGILEHLGNDEPRAVGVTLTYSNREVVAVHRVPADESLTFDHQVRHDDNHLWCQNFEAGLRDRRRRARLKDAHA